MTIARSLNTFAMFCLRLSSDPTTSTQVDDRKFSGKLLDRNLRPPLIDMRCNSSGRGLIRRGSGRGDRGKGSREAEE
jgi:hypothetical protein